LETLIKQNDITDYRIRIKDLMLLERVVKKINSILDKKELLKQIVEDVSKTLGFTRCAVLFYDDIMDILQVEALYGWENTQIKEGTQLYRNKGIVWKAVREKRMIYFPDVLNHPDEIPCDFTSRSHIDMPLFNHGKLIGLLNVQHRVPGAFGKPHFRLLNMLASHITIALENSRLYEKEKKIKEAILRDLREAQDIQKSLFPKDPLTRLKISISGMCEPCFEVGGDWYDYIELPSGKIGVVLADVAGKGLSAALLMSSARTIIRMIALREESPVNVLKEVNKILSADMPSSKFITLVYAVIDLETREITIANAGHHYPAIYSNETVSYLVTDAGLPLGIKTFSSIDFSYKEQRFTMKAGDKVFLYSDGVVEAMNSKKEMFGDERLTLSLKKSGSDVYTLYNDIKNFVKETLPSDDLTIVMIEATKITLT
jgi:sigma-B regulation protein RsbU (phosphoserine phosphatase)